MSNGFDHLRVGGCWGPSGRGARRGGSLFGALQAIAREAEREQRRLEREQRRLEREQRRQEREAAREAKALERDRREVLRLIERGVLAVVEGEVVTVKGKITVVQETEPAPGPAPAPAPSLRDRLASFARTVLWVAIVGVSTVFGVALYTILTY